MPCPFSFGFGIMYKIKFFLQENSIVKHFFCINDSMKKMQRMEWRREEHGCKGGFKDFGAKKKEAVRK